MEVQPIYIHGDFANLPGLLISVDDVNMTGHQILPTGIEGDCGCTTSDVVQLPALIERCFPNGPCTGATRTATGKKSATRNPH